MSASLDRKQTPPPENATGGGQSFSQTQLPSCRDLKCLLAWEFVTLVKEGSSWKLFIFAEDEANCLTPEQSSSSL